MTDVWCVLMLVPEDLVANGMPLIKAINLIIVILYTQDIIPADVEALMNEDQVEMDVTNLGEAELTGEGEEPSHNGE